LPKKIIFASQNLPQIGAKIGAHDVQIGALEVSEKMRRPTPPSLLTLHVLA